MAQINLGNFGSLIAQPVGPPRVGSSVHNPVAAAIGDLGEIGMQLAGNMLRTEQQAQDRRTREQLAQEREQRRVEAARIHQTTVNTLAGLSDALAAENAEGKVDKNDLLPQWNERSQKVIDEAVGRMPTELQDAGLTLLLGAQGRGADQMRTIKATRDRQDTAAGVRSYLAESERYAARGGAQADEAIRNVSQFLSSPVAAAAGLDGQETARRFAESVRFRQAADLVQANPAAALTTLRNKDAFPELDPDKRASLIAHADAAVLRLQERARIEAERRAREQDRVFTAASAVFEAGRSFSPQYSAQVLAQLRGSPYEAAIREMVTVGPMNVAAATLPVDQQQAALDALRSKANTQGSSPTLEKEIQRREKVLTSVRAAVKQDPLTAANDYGVLPALRPIEITNLNAIPQQLAERVDAARTVSVWAGRPVSPLRADEARSLGSLLEALPVAQRADALRLVAQAIPDPQQRQALAAQIVEDKQPLGLALAAASSMTSRGRSVSELILKGHDADKSGVLKDKPRNANDLATIAREIDGVQWSSQQARDAALRATTLIYRALQADGSANVQQAIRLGTGGITDINGAKVTRPWGWDDDDFRAAINRGRDAIILQSMNGGSDQVLVNGREVTLSTVARQWRDVQLRNYGDGLYAVIAGGGVVMQTDGRPFLYRVQ